VTGQELDVSQLRADTPACATLTHLNNAGSALPPRQVVAAQVDHLNLEAAIGGYEAHAERADAIAAVPESIATLMSCRADQVAIVESATAAWDRGLQAVALAEDFGPTDRFLVSAAEYASNVLPLYQLARRFGCRVEFIPDAADGSTDVDAFSAMLDEDVRIVSITHAASHNGVVNDVIAIGDALRYSGSSSWYFVDACQSVGQLDVHASRIGADIISATGRKFLRGPRGTGFLIASDRILTDIEPFPLDLHSATWTGADTYTIQEGARRFETWEHSYAAVLGLGAAVDYALQCQIPPIQQRIQLLANLLRTELAEIPGATVHDRGDQISGIVTASFEQIPADRIVPTLREHGINTSLSSADYAPLDFAREGVTTKVRLSPHAYNTEQEIDSVIATLRGLVSV
jgi:cysteine desulfurase / selenocysteine lyase